MAFETVQKFAGNHGSKPKTNFVVARPGYGNSPRVRIAISSDVADMCGFAKGSAVSLRLGTGNDSGRLEIAPARADDVCWKVGSEGGRMVMVSISAFAIRAMAMPKKSTECTFKFKNGALIVDLPAEMYQTDAAAAA